MFATNSDIIERHTVQMRSMVTVKILDKDHFIKLFTIMRWNDEWDETYGLDVACSLSKAEYSS